jgi:hypothetical protein
MQFRAISTLLRVESYDTTILPNQILTKLFPYSNADPKIIQAKQPNEALSIQPIFSAHILYPI